MVWFTIVLLVMAVLVINDRFNSVRKLIDENDERYASRFTDIEIQLRKSAQ